MYRSTARGVFATSPAHDCSRPAIEDDSYPMLRPILLLTVAVFAATLSACSTANRADFLADYQAGRYAQAHRAAVDTASKHTGPRREQAALTAGLAAHALRDYAEADRWLSPLTSNSNAEISGRASAALGLIRAEQNQYQQAAALLSQAATRLNGDEAARAGLHAGEAFLHLGRPQQARVQFSIAHAAAQDPALGAELLAQLNRTGYAVQVGAFRTRHNADVAAQQIRAFVVGLGYDPPRVIPTAPRDGRNLFLVQVGRFTTRAAAEEAKRRIGRRSMVASAVID